LNWATIRWSFGKSHTIGTFSRREFDHSFRPAFQKIVIKLTSCMRFALIAFFCLPYAYAQETTCAVHVLAQLINKNLDLKPVPKLMFFMREAAATRRKSFSTGFDGVFKGELPCGAYVLTTEQPVELDGKKYSWDIKVQLVPGQTNELDLSVDNASTKEAPPTAAVPSGRSKDEMSGLFKKYEPSVVTVWSELGHGTGFFVTESGLILTNQHVIGPSEYISVQSDSEHKVRAILLASDAEKDVAVLWADRSGLPDTVVAPLALRSESEQLAEVGERVFTIGSPLSQRKILTTGIVSKLEERAIISDININPGNSGGPLFNSLGRVIGLTTFGESNRGSGPGISGIVRIEQVEDVLSEAQRKSKNGQPPSPALLPVEPKLKYPVSSLKVAVSSGKFDVRPYVFAEGDYHVAIITPILKYELSEGEKVRAATEKAKRTRGPKAVAQTTFQPLDDMRNWAEYAGEYEAVIQIRATPQLRETVGSAFLRGMTATNGVSTIPAKMRFKADFYKMRLTCGGKEVEPIHPGKIAKVISVKDRFINATDATYEGLYTYPADAISPSCGEVSLDIYSEKDVVKAKVRALSQKTIERVWADSEPVRQADPKSR
jgi:S1-C subfamily serine protease